MSLHFGYDQESSLDVSSIAFPVVHLYHFWYKGLNPGRLWLNPYGLEDGHPAANMNVSGRLQSTSTLKLLDHTFDNDSTLGDLFKVRYHLTCIMNDGRTETVNLGDVEMATKRHGSINHNIFMINETFVISKLLADYKNIDVMNISFKQLDTQNTTNHNESVLNVETCYRMYFP